MSAFSKAIRKQIALGRSLELRPLHRRTDGQLVGVHLRLRGCPDDPDGPQEDRYMSNDLLDDIRVMHDRALAECVEHMGTMLTAALARARGAHPNGLRR